MEKRFAPVLLLACLVLVAPSSAVEPGDEVSKENVIVLFDSNEHKDAAAVATHGSVTGSASIVPAVFATVPANALPALERLDHVVAVEGDAEVELVDKPPWAGGPGGGGDDDSGQPPQETPWGIDRIDGTEAATFVNEGDVDVAVLDTGVDYEHPDLDANVEIGVSTTGNGPVKEGLKFARDKNGHGTHVAGTVAAENNSIGVVGVAPSPTCTPSRSSETTAQGPTATSFRAWSGPCRTAPR